MISLWSDDHVVRRSKRTWGNERTDSQSPYLFLGALLSMSRLDGVSGGVSLGSVRMFARHDHRPAVPVFAATSDDVSLVVTLTQPPTTAGGIPERRGCAAFVVTDPASMPRLDPVRCSLSLVFPAKLLRGIGLSDVGAMALDTHSALFWPFLTFAWVCSTAGERQSGLTAYYAERLLQEMVTGVVVASLQHAASRAPAQAYSAALAVIVARVGDPELTPASVAAEVRTSLRTLQRQFFSHGTTMDRSIRKARVGHAVSLLEDPVYDSLTVDRVAHACGLSNGSSLARAFAAEGYPAPAAVRASRSAT